MPTAPKGVEGRRRDPVLGRPRIQRRSGRRLVKKASQRASDRTWSSLANDQVIKAPRAGRSGAWVPATSRRRCQRFWTPLAVSQDSASEPDTLVYASENAIAPNGWIASGGTTSYAMPRISVAHEQRGWRAQTAPAAGEKRLVGREPSTGGIPKGAQPRTLPKS
jgi:hypothetical protein